MYYNSVSPLNLHTNGSVVGSCPSRLQSRGQSRELDHTAAVTFSTSRSHAGNGIAVDFGHVNVGYVTANGEIERRLSSSSSSSDIFDDNSPTSVADDIYQF